MLSPAQKMATCKLDDGPRAPHSLSPTTWSPPEFKANWGLGCVNQTEIEYKRSVSSNVDGRGTSADGLGVDKPFSKWGAAMLCKQHVGTREWVNCGENTCKELLEELRHMAECPRKMLGGCKTKCKPLKEELRKFRELQPKYPTISQSQFVYWQHAEQSFEHGLNNLASDEVQAKLQALTIEEYVNSTTVFSPTSPVIEEPFQSQPLPRRGQNYVDVDDSDDSLVSSIVELIPLDQCKLSIENGCFRKHEEWESISFLGKGTFGTTFLCYNKRNESYFAIKKITVSHFNKEEIQIWQRLSGEHPNIINLYGAVESGKRVLIFMEYMNGGSVGDYLAENGPLEEKHALDLFQQVLRGLDFMHRNSIIHGDVKAANVLMDDIGVHVKLADFGSCVDLRSIERGKNAELVGTLIFMAPEICRSEFPSTSADIWSAVCFLVQMISGKPPWAEYLHVNAGLRFIVGSAKRPPQLPSCSEAVKEIFTQGFHVEARSRPSAAELLRHRVFALDETDLELFRFDGFDEDVDDQEDDNSMNDCSLEYHSSHSPFCSDDEYFSSLDDLDNSDVDVVNDKTSPPKAKTEQHACKRFDSKGGTLSTAVACCCIEVSRDTLQCTARLGIRCLDPVKFYKPLIDGGLYGNVKILSHVHQLLPDGQTFPKPVTVKVTLSENLHQSEDLVVLHGRLSETKCDITWEDVTNSSSVLPFEHSIAVTLPLHHFSYLLAFRSSFSLLRELYLSCFNYQLDLLRFMVFTRTHPKTSDSRDICLVAMRESFHASPAADQYSICRRLKDDGFRALYGKRSEHLCPNEQLKVSLKFAHGKVLSRPTEQSYTVKCPFGGEEVGRWELDTCGVKEPLSGSVTLTRSAGQDYPFQFWEHEPTRYVQDVLKLDTLEHVNMIPIAKAVGLNEVEITELVDKASDDEEQLKEITECWHRKAENHRLSSLEEFVTQVSKQSLLVSDRGKFHLVCLNDFNKKWQEKNDRDEKIDENDQFFKTMETNGRDMCRSALSDCILEIDQSEDRIRASIDMLKSVETLFEHVKETNPGSVKLGKLLQLLKPDEENCSTAGDTAKSRIFCEQLAGCIPWLMQVVKDLFKVHVRKTPTGMWGIDPDACALDQTTKTAEERLPSNEVWCRICEVLRKLCARNPGWINEHVDLEEMERTLDVLGMLRVLAICDKEWTRLAARIQHFRLLSKEITRNTLPRVLSANLQNVLRWLQRYVKFCPTHLVQFTFLSVSTEAKNGPLEYDKDSMSFTQSLTLAEETLTVVDLRLKIDISVNGCRYSKVIETSVKMVEQVVQGDTECVTMSIVYEHSGSGTGFLKILDKSRKCLFDKCIEGSKSETDGALNEDMIPKPSETEPKPSKTEPKPSETEPKPSETEPKPSETEQKPSKTEPKPSETEPKPSETEQKPSETEPKPSETEPKPSEIEPKPSDTEPKHKKGSPVDDVFQKIASRIPKEWKKLGRELLEHHNSAVESIDEDLKAVEDKAFRVLQKWKQTLGSDANYSRLYEALCKVGRKDLADEYCLETPATVL